MKLVVANWKQHKDIQEARAWINKFNTLWETHNPLGVEVVICPPYTLLAPLQACLPAQPHIQLGSQDVSNYTDGPHTGLVGINQLKGLVTHSIVGHSELSEPRKDTYAKAELCLTNHIIPIICAKTSDELIPLNGAIYVVEDPENISGGHTYRPKDPKDINQAVNLVKKSLTVHARILYGGSVTTDNSKDLAQLSTLDGALVGSASLEAGSFFQIVKNFSTK